MRFKLVRVRNRGRRLTRAEIEAATPLVGDLLIRDMPAARNGANRSLRYADLIDLSSPQVARPLLQPLFDPVLVRATPESILLIGYEIHPGDGVTHEYVQGWLLRAV